MLTESEFPDFSKMTAEEYAVYMNKIRDEAIAEGQQKREHEKNALISANANSTGTLTPPFWLQATLVAIKAGLLIFSGGEIDCTEAHIDWDYRDPNGGCGGMNEVDQLKSEVERLKRQVN